MEKQELSCSDGYRFEKYIREGIDAALVEDYECLDINMHRIWDILSGWRRDSKISESDGIWLSYMFYAAHHVAIDRDWKHVVRILKRMLVEFRIIF